MIVLKMKWFEKNPGVKKDDIGRLRDIPYTFPSSYLKFLKLSDGGMPDTSDFDYFDVSLKDTVGQAVGIFYSLISGELNLIKEYFSPPEFFPEGLVAFAETGNGDLICFDYRNDPKTGNPPIVYWNHEAEVGKDVSFIAKDFEEFLSILKEPKD